MPVTRYDLLTFGGAGMADLDEDSAVSMLSDCLICVASGNQCLETDSWLLEHLFSAGG